MKRAALIAGVSLASLVCAAPAKVSAAWNAESWWSGFPGYSAPSPEPRRLIRRPRPKALEHKAGGASDNMPPIPPGPLHVIVSIDKQRATLFADGRPVASTAISSGTASHPTPMGVFTVIQKSRHHVSNLYDAPMPYMQRITWSGSALHEGPLPGYPASHGCVRLTSSFAQLLWKATKMGARIIVTRPDVAPLEFEHARLFSPRPKVAAAPVEAPEPLVKVAAAQRTSEPAGPEPATKAPVPNVRIADAANATVAAVLSVAGGNSKAVTTLVETVPAANAPGAAQPTKLAITEPPAEAAPAAAAQAAARTVEARPVETSPVEANTVETKPVRAKSVAVEAKPLEAKPAPAIAAPAPIIVDERPKSMPARVVQEANGRPISVFASLKEGKLYVRQGWKPLFEAPVSFEHPERPIGTHVYTAMGVKTGGTDLRWTVVSIPSSTQHVAELKVPESGRKSRHEHAIKAVEVAAPMPSPSAALDRIVMPPELAERISGLITSGSSLILSDNRLSDETGDYTDFIVLTR